MTKIIVFYLLSTLLVVSAGLVVTLRHLFYCALCLAVCMACTAGFFILLGAEFLAVVQILIYIGAITVLIIFSILLTQRIADKTLQHINRLRYFSVLVTGLLLAMMIHIFFNNFDNYQETAFQDYIPTLGHLLLNEFVLPFELVSILLLVALVGAIAISKKGKT